MRYTDDTFTEQFISTIGVDFKLTTIEMNGKAIKLQVWDTAGQERFKSITASYYRGANGVLLCFDVTEPESFEAIQHWIENSKRLASSQIPFVLIGNKVDLKKQRVITTAQAKDFADRAGIPYVECSAKAGTGIDTAFNALVNLILLKKETHQRKAEPSSLSAISRPRCCN